jgi:phosphatidate phosphatase LPIN
MKLGEGGEAFFVFETEGDVPKALITSPVISASSSPSNSPKTPESLPPLGLQEPEFLDLSDNRIRSRSPDAPSSPKTWAQNNETVRTARSVSPRLTSSGQHTERVRMLTQKFTDINIPSKVTDNGDILLDMTGYKSGEEDIKHSEALVRRILAEEFGMDSSLELDEHGNLRIPSWDESLPGSFDMPHTIASHHFASDPALATTVAAEQGASHYVKTLRLTSDQLKSLELHRGTNEISFSVNKAVCTARMFYWSCKSPIVISDIDGTITKSDALGHVLTMLGRDWTHMGVSKLFTDISSNGYNIMYLTARSVGQADSTRSYLKSVDQNRYKLPEGPVILSPDRTMAALHREVIMRKPEVFKMACLRDIQSLFGQRDETPFYAGFGNRITDALSYRSVGVPSSKIFTINSNSEVHMELLELAGYKSSYVNIVDLVDHFFPPVSTDRLQGQQTFTDVNFWRDPLPVLSDESDDDVATRGRSPPNREVQIVDEAIDDEDDDEDYDDGFEGGEDDYESDEEYVEELDLDLLKEQQQHQYMEDQHHREIDEDDDLDGDLLDDQYEDEAHSGAMAEKSQEGFITATEALKRLKLGSTA